jgi:tektin-2
VHGANNSSGDYANFWIIFKVAQTRLENRTYRPNVELCRDAAQYQLCHEVREIEGTVKALVEKLQEAQNAHNSLNDNLRNIEEDLAIKVIMIMVIITFL